MIRVVSPPPRRRQNTPIKPVRSSKFKKADVIRAVEAARASGLTVAELEIKLDGSAIRISSPEAKPRTDGDLFNRWEDRL